MRLRTGSGASHTSEHVQSSGGSKGASTIRGMARGADEDETEEQLVEEDDDDHLEHQVVDVKSPSTVLIAAASAPTNAATTTLSSTGRIPSDAPPPPPSSYSTTPASSSSSGSGRLRPDSPQVVQSSSRPSSTATSVRSLTPTGGAVDSTSSTKTTPSPASTKQQSLIPPGWTDTNEPDGEEGSRRPSVLRAGRTASTPDFGQKVGMSALGLNLLGLTLLQTEPTTAPTSRHPHSERSWTDWIIHFLLSLGRAAASNPRQGPPTTDRR